MLESPSEPFERSKVAGHQKGKEKPRTPSSQVLPSERFPFKVHLDLFKRFSALSHNGTQAVEASRIEGEGVPTQAAQLNVRFLVSIGLLTKTERGSYLPSPELIRFVAARTVSDDRARPILRAILEPSWFVQVAQSVLSPIKPLRAEDFLGELAIAAQTDKMKKGPALQVLLDYLSYIGIVNAKDEGLTLVEDDRSRFSPSGSFDVSSSPRTVVEGAGTIQGDNMWHMIQTEDFSLKIRSDITAIDDLLDHVQTVRRKIERLQKAKVSTNPNTKDAETSEVMVTQ